MSWSHHLWLGMTALVFAPHALDAQTGAALTTEAIAARAVPATVTIVTFDGRGDTLGMGSGFLVRSNGTVVTNFHVMAGATRAAVILTSGERYERVEALDQDSAGDLAILKIPGYGLPTLPTQAALPPVGAKVVAVGNPLGLSRTVSEGIVSAVRLAEGREILQMSAPISPGSSGGPVLNARGQVVAVATSYLERGQSLNFAVPVRYAMGLVESASTPVPLAQAFGLAGLDRTATNEAGESQPRSATPARTSRPRPGILGTWTISERIAGGAGFSEAFDFTGFLFLGGHDLGLLAMMPNGREGRKVTVMFVQSHTASGDGRLTVQMGGATLDGYQTDEGFYAEGTYEGSKGPLQINLAGVPGELALSSPSGLYAIEAKTLMFAKNVKMRDVVFDNWSGEAAVVFANDSVYVDLVMADERDQRTSASFMGPVVDGRFTLINKEGDKLEGSAASGRLQAFWVDGETWGGYQGGLTGRRK